MLCCVLYNTLQIKQDIIFRCKRLSTQCTGANFVHVYLEIWDTGILKFNKFSMQWVKKNNNVILFINLYEFSWSSNILVILGSPRDLVCTLLFIKTTTTTTTKKQQKKKKNAKNVVNKWAASCENVSSGICGQRRPRSACPSAQSDQGLRCPLTGQMTLQNVSMGSKCPDETSKHVWDESESVHFLNARRHLCPWRGLNKTHYDLSVDQAFCGSWYLY